ncbi:MAG: DUF1127 domain-containing protein [Rhodobacteraceae bacterium]|nr:DUF1127 domain-containing protein [Paracoccaceae bacterium]
MAQTSLHISERPGVFALPKRILHAIGAFLVAVAENNDRVRQVEFLRNLSDQELAARGIKREDIVRHVFASHVF